MEALQSNADDEGGAYCLTLDEAEEEGFNDDGEKKRGFLLATSHSDSQAPCVRLWRVEHAAGGEVS